MSRPQVYQSMGQMFGGCFIEETASNGLDLWGGSFAVCPDGEIEDGVYVENGHIPDEEKVFANIEGDRRDVVGMMINKLPPRLNRAQGNNRRQSNKKKDSRKTSTSTRIISGKRNGNIILTKAH